MIFDQIIEYRKERGIEFGESYATLLRYYKAALRYGYLEYIVENGRIQGFVDWMRLPCPPEKRDFNWMTQPGIGKGEWVYITTICAREKKYFWELIKRVRRKEGHKAKHLCWHNKDGILKVFKNKGGRNVKGSKKCISPDRQLIYQA